MKPKPEEDKLNNKQIDVIKTNQNLLTPTRMKENKIQRVPNFIIFGFSKCGTRAFIDFLALHPNVLSAGPEIDFFNRNYELGLQWYAKRMPASYSSQIVVEKSPEYVHDLNTPLRIYKMNSTVKLMALVCDPVRRSVSEYVQWNGNTIRRGKPSQPFEHYVIDEQTGNVKLSKLIERGRYSVYMRTWLRQFPKNQIYVADGDLFRTDPIKELKNVEKFLGLAPYFDNSLFTYDAKKGFYCPLGKCFGETKGRPHPTVDPGILQKVKNYFKPYNEELFKMIGKRYNW